MTHIATGQVVCQVHLAAAVKDLMKDGGAILQVQEIQSANTHFCSCRIQAEFYVENVGRIDVDEPFPIFRRV